MGIRPVRLIFLWSSRQSGRKAVADLPSAVDQSGDRLEDEIEVLIFLNRRRPASAHIPTTPPKFDSATKGKEPTNILPRDVILHPRYPANQSSYPPVHNRRIISLHLPWRRPPSASSNQVHWNATPPGSPFSCRLLVNSPPLLSVSSVPVMGPEDWVLVAAYPRAIRHWSPPTAGGATPLRFLLTRSSAPSKL